MRTTLCRILLLILALCAPALPVTAQCVASSPLTTARDSSLTVGDTASAQLRITVRLTASGGGCVVAWSSSDTTRARVSPAGLVRAIGAGKASIRATIGGVSDIVPISVVAAAVATTPAPTPAPDPSPSPTPAPQASSYMPTASDRFTGYTSTAQLLASVGSGKPYCEFIDAKRIALDPSVTYAGHQTVRVDQPAGSSGIARLASCFASQDFWFRIKLRFSPGWTTAGSANSANSFKMFGWWWRSGDGRGDLEITNGTGYQVHFDPQFSGKPFVSVNSGSVASEWSDGAWYDYIVHYQASGSTSRTRWWMARDGAAPVLRGTASGAVAAMAAGLGFPFYFNQTVRAAQSLWIGQWELVDGAKYVSPWGL